MAYFQDLVFERIIRVLKRPKIKTISAKMSMDSYLGRLSMGHFLSEAGGNYMFLEEKGKWNLYS